MPLSAVLGSFREDPTMSPAASGRIEEPIVVWSARVEPRRLEDGLARGTRVEEIFVPVLR